jgi:hypothetical protein
MSDQFFDQIKERIKRIIRKKNLDLDNLKKLIVSHNYTFLENYNKVFHESENLHNDDKINFYGDIFKVVLKYLINTKKEHNMDVVLISNDFIQDFIDDIVDRLVLEKLCFNCKSSDIYKKLNPFDETKSSYYCRHCQRSIKVFQNIKHLPKFLIFLNDLSSI